jgi:hypothetical protein
LELKKKLSEIFLPATVALTMKKKKGLLTIQDVNKCTGHTNLLERILLLSKRANGQSQSGWLTLVKDGT